MIGAGVSIVDSAARKSVNRGPFNFNKAKTDRYRVGMFGTSIGAASTGTLQKLEEIIKKSLGATTTRSLVLGGLGGSYDNVLTGNWYRQPYGGPGFVRLRGATGATPIVRSIVYGNQIEYYYSQETDSAPHVINIDGTDYTVGAAGAQAIGQKATFNVTLGPHVVTINPPAVAGYCYPERLLSRNTAEVGVEVEDFTYGGSSLNNAVTVRAKTNQQVDGIAIVGDNGINAQFDVPNLDLAIITFTVNDAGMNPVAGGWVRGGGFATALNKLLNGFRAKGVPVIYLIEMAGHFIMPNDAGSGDRLAAYNAAKAAILAQNGNGVLVLDWDTQNRNAEDILRYATLNYQPQVAANLNIANGTYSTADFIHPLQYGYRASDDLLSTATKLTIPYDSTADKEFAARARYFPDNLKAAKSITVDGVTKTLTPTEPAIQPLTDSFRECVRQLPVFTDPAAVLTSGATSLRTSIANSPLSDAHGKYIELASNNLGGFATTGDYWVVMKIGGQPNFRSGSATLRTIIDGAVVAYTDAPNFRTQMSWSHSLPAGSEAPITIAVNLRATATGQVFTLIAGRLYEISVVKASHPVRVDAAASWFDSATVTHVDWDLTKFWGNGAEQASQAAWLTAMSGVDSGGQLKLGGILTGAEKLLNGAFAADVSSWTPVVSGGSTVTWDAAGKAILTSDGATGNGAGGAGITQGFATIVDHAYMMSVTIETATQGVRLGGATASGVGSTGGTVAAGAHFFTYSAQATETEYAYIFRNGAGTGRVDNVSVREVLPFTGYVPETGLVFEVEGTMPAALPAATQAIVALSFDSSIGTYGPEAEAKLLWMTNGELRIQSRVTNALLADINLGVVAANSPFKVRVALKKDGYYAKLNDGLAQTDLSGRLAGFAYLRLKGSKADASFTGTLKKFKVYADGNPARFFAGTNTIRMNGDSFIGGASGVSLPATLQTLMGRQVFADGVGGSQMQGIYDRFADATKALLLRQTTIIWDGDEDTSLTLANVGTYMSTLANAIALLNHNRFVLVPPCVSDGQTDWAVQNAIRDIMVARWPSNVVDWRGKLPQTGNVLNASNFLDGIHLTQASMDIMAAALRDFIVAKGW